MRIEQHIADDLSRLAREAGYSVRSLSRAAAITHATSQRILAATPVDIDLAQRVAELLGAQVIQSQRLSKISK